VSSNAPVVRVPGSSANLGPGFDGVGMAVSLYADVGLVSGGIPERAHAADRHHPADIAFRRLGGTGDVWVRSEIPMGRGLGFSGAVRVGGALLGAMLGGESGDTVDETVRDEVFRVAAELEGHGDNVAASLYGGVVGTNGHRAARVGVNIPLDVVVWIPTYTTSTSDSRNKLATMVPLADAVFNISHTALLLAALNAGDVRALGEATADRMHQDLRLAAVPASREALESGVDAGAICGWLSGSGPTVAFFAHKGDGEVLARELPASGTAKVLSIDEVGARCNV
jgi:homoserine kinase